MNILHTLHFAANEKPTEYKIRLAARGVVINQEHKVSLIHVKAKNYYKLPGGGLEGNEDLSQCFKRECREEVGLDVEITDNLGIIEEFRDPFAQHQITVVLVANQLGKSSSIQLTEWEQGLEFEPTWQTPEMALTLVKEAKPTNEFGEWVQQRDSVILEHWLATKH